MNYIDRLFGHFITITKHRILVRKMCFKSGLIKQGLLHDLSKYSFKEFHNGVKYYQGYRSPIAREKELNNGHSIAWTHHTKVNKHHWEHWDKKYNKNINNVYDLPFNYLIESAIDRIAACKVYEKDKYNKDSAYNFLIKSKERINMSNNNSRRLEKLLLYLKENDEHNTLAYYKILYKKWKKDKNFDI